MNRHAKASSARSTLGRGSVLGRIFRGAFATRASFLGSDGSGARSSGRAGALVLAVAVLALAPSASAADRGASASFASFPGGSPQALTVDQSNGDVYATDPASGLVHRFDSQGNAKNFTAGPGAGTNKLSGFLLSEGPGAVGIAVDNSGGPDDGDIYVTIFDEGSETFRVAIFSNAGAPLGTLGGSGTPDGSFAEPCGVAVDQANGNLYVADGSGKVWRYTPTGGTIEESDYSGGISTSGPCAVAADQGKVYVGQWSNGPITRFAASDFVTGAPPAPAGTEIDAKGRGLAVDPSNGDLYVDEGDQVAVFDSSGTSLYNFGSAADFGNNSVGVAVKGNGGKAYVADLTNRQIDVYPLLARVNSASFASFPAGSPQALTVDQSNGDVYATDPTGGLVHRFDSQGNPKNFTAGPGAGTNKLSGFLMNEGPGAVGIAVDNSGGPDDGDIYVTIFDEGSETFRVAIFSNAGAPLGTLGGSGTPDGSFAEPCGVAVDQANGNLYVADGSGKVWRYTPTGGTIEESDYSGGISTSGPCAVAADQGKVYVGQWSNGPITRFAASDFVTGAPPAPAGTEIDAKGRGLAVDPSNGDLYVDEGDQVAVFDSSGTSLYNFGSAADFGNNSVGVAVKGNGGKAYVADLTNRQIDVYGFVYRRFEASFASFPAGSPQALTVDQSNGDVYATDPTGGLVHRFDSQGNPKNFTAGPGAGTNKLSGFLMNEGPGAVGIAVDNSGGPDDGDIYVTIFDEGSETFRVAIFSNAGAPLGTLGGSGTPDGSFAEPCGVAVDQANGNLYVADGSGKVWRYTPTGGTIEESDYSGGISTSGPCAVAADQGKVYVGQWSNGPITRFAASDFVTGAPPAPAGTEIDAKGRGLAVDPSNGDLYVDEGDQVAVFDSSGTSLYNFGSAADFGNNSVGVAVKGNGGKAYVADLTNRQIDVYGFTGPSGGGAPAAITKPATTVGLTTATVNATVNPRSALVSDCHFDYVDDAAFQAHGFTGASTAPCVPDPGQGASAVSVHADLTGLLNGGTYHFRISATNSSGTGDGQDAAFTTGPAIAFTDPATGTDHHTNATIHGHIDPTGQTITNCEFDWGTTTAYGNTADCAEGDSFTGPASVGAFINNLAPGVTIHYRLHLTTAAGDEAVGADRNFAPKPGLERLLTDTIGSPGSGAGQLSIDVKNPNGSTKIRGANGVAVDQQTGDVYVADTGNHRVVKYAEDGSFLLAFGADVVASGPDDVPGPTRCRNSPSPMPPVALSSSISRKSRLLILPSTLLLPLSRRPWRTCPASIRATSRSRAQTAVPGPLSSPGPVRRPPSSS